jgi:peptidoglycan/xylan/chitin deacetylase (PgdA/CDA1 family)
MVCLAWMTVAAAAGCDEPARGLGVARVLQIETSAGPLFGDLSKLEREQSFLNPKEVVLTFDDGPMPWITKSILDTLDRFCTKATFFAVGRMAIEYPSSVKDVLARGHTLGSHTWSHPYNVAALPSEKARDEIERGFAAVALAAGRPIAPFFRFPGLSDSPSLLAYLQSRGVAAFTVDVVSNDSFMPDAKRLAELTLRRIEERQGGIVLFHDIKASTARALPAILAQLQARGYKVVHLTAKGTFQPHSAYEAELSKLLAQSIAAQGRSPRLVPFYGTVGPDPLLKGVPVAQLAPEPRVRAANAEPKAEGDEARRRAIARGNGTAPAWTAAIKRTRPVSEATETWNPFALFQ